MNILHTETLKKWGGQQNRVLQEAVGLRERGHYVVIACQKDSILADKAGKAGLKVYELNFRGKNYLMLVPKLAKIVRQENIDIVSTHSSADSWAGGMAAGFTGTKLVRFRHNLYPMGRGLPAKLIYSMPERIIAISGAVKDVFVQHGMGNKKIAIIPDAVDTQIFNPGAEDLRAELKILPETLVIGNTSTFTEVKGQEYLLKAFNIIGRKVPCILLFAGRLMEPARSRYLSHVDPELRDKVIFLGHRDDVPGVLKTLDVFVFPSFLEGLGTALLEAMMMEKAVTVSDIPTFRDFVEEGENGVYFKAKDFEDIAEKVIALLQNKVLRDGLGRNARATALEKFTVGKMLDLTEACYTEVFNAV
ncbi:MAG: glycosyltransferase family 1 protein [Nitrospiraceae bacterium]|nr:MAG: glycosyltransferase family 1 protein [Nitrospiraceae bacterium]